MLPPGFQGSLTSQGSTLRAVVIQGQTKHETHDENDAKILEPGSYFSSEGELVHRLSCEGSGCLIYVRNQGRFGIVPTF